MIWWLLALIPIAGLYVARRWCARRRADEAHRYLLVLLSEHGGWILRGGILMRASQERVGDDSDVVSARVSGGGPTTNGNDDEAELSREISDNLDV